MSLPQDLKEKLDKARGTALQPSLAERERQIYSYARQPWKRKIAERHHDAQKGLCNGCKQGIFLEIDHIDNNPRNWDDSNIQMLCKSCNLSKRGAALRSPTTKRERLSSGTIQTFAHNSAKEGDKSEVMRARWLSWIADLKEGPFSQFDIISVRSLCAWAPRGCARKELGEVSLGVPQSYEDYIEMDSSAYGGPLHIFTPEEGDLKGVLCVEYQEQKPKLETLEAEWR